MGKKCFLIPSLILLLAGIVLCSFFILHRYQQKNIHLLHVRCGLRFLEEKNATIYINHDGLYELDINSGKWHLKVADTKGYHPQDAAIGGDLIFFGDTYSIYSMSIGSQNSRKTVAQVNYSPDTFAISHNGKRLAYRKQDDILKQQTVMVLHVDEGTEQKVFSGGVYSITWSLDDSSLFMETDEGIVQLTLEGKDIKLVADGFSLKELPNNCIGYCKGEEEPSTKKRYIVFYKMNLVTNIEDQLFRIAAAGFQGAAWDPTGRFLVVSIMARAKMLSFDLGTMLVIWDTQLGKQYELPTFKKVSGCIFWVDKKKEQN